MSEKIEKRHCQACGGKIAFDASTFREGEARTVKCPHCAKDTILTVDSHAQTHHHQALVLSSPNPVSLTLGIIGVIVGVFAVMAGWIPVLGLAVIPASIIGILLSVGGIIYACTRKFKSIELPILGAGLCIVAILISLFSAFAAGEAIKATAQAAEKAIKERQENERQAALAAQQQQEQNRKNQISSWKTELATLTPQLTDKNKSLSDAQNNMSKVQADYDAFMSAKPWTTNQTVVNLREKIIALGNQRNGAAQTLITMQQDYKNQLNFSYIKDQATSSRQAAMAQDLSEIQNARNLIESLDEQIPAMQEQMETMLQQIQSFQNDKLRQARRNLTDAQIQYDQVNEKINAINANLAQN